jgi:hypothetical protein
MNSPFIHSNVMATSQHQISKLHQHNEYTLFNHEIAYDEGKDDDTSATIVQGGEEDIVPSLTTTRTTKNLHKQDIVLNHMYDWYVTLQGTSDLRVGLNSGLTTAGVLRGEKARFQLFGDVRR